MVTYSMSSENYALLLADRPFPSLLFYQSLLFRLYFRINNLAVDPQKI